MLRRVLAIALNTYRESVRARILIGLAAVIAAAIPPTGSRGDGPNDNRGDAPLRYTIERPENVFVSTRPLNGRNTLFVTLQFRILNVADKRLATDIAKDEIHVEEDGVPVTSFEITSPAVEPLKTVLALDISGSMDAAGKWPQAREAAHTFLDRLDPRSDTGLILFDHLLRKQEPPAADRAEYAAHRDVVRRLEINYALVHIHKALRSAGLQACRVRRT